MTGIVWGLLTGIITGGIWVAILLVSKQRRLSEQHQAMLEETNRRLDELEYTNQRVLDLEERLDFAERLLAEGRPRLPPEGQQPVD